MQIQRHKCKILAAMIVALVLVGGCSPSEMKTEGEVTVSVAVSPMVVIAAKPTNGEWHAKKKSKNSDKDGYLKKKQEYLDNPTPGKLNAMMVARAKYQGSAKSCRAYRENLRKNN
jgi:hypothetical protein